MGKSLVHANGNRVAAIDVETTGLTPFHNDIIQIAVLVLDSELRIDKSVLPFYTEMKPRRPENANYEAMRVTKLNYCKILQRAMTEDRVADLFEEWYNKLKLPVNKKIMPLAMNWPFDSQFIQDWLGIEHYRHFFHGHFRDLQAAALFENDKADFQIEPYPFPKIGLHEICNSLNVISEKPHDALSDARDTAECYRKLLLQGAAVIRVEGLQRE